MKAALDTNAVVDICQNDAWTVRLIAHLKTNPSSELVLLAQVGKEFDSSKLSTEEQDNFHKLEKASTSDSHNYFTIGQSTIGGPDTIRGDINVTTGIQREVFDINSIYSNYVADQRRSGQPVKSMSVWNRFKE